jgi:hypothetical protein
MTNMAKNLKICPSCFEKKISQGKCSECNFSEIPNRDPSYLPYRVRLAGSYLVGKEIARGETSITYLAGATTGKVIIKEYFPRHIAVRNIRTLSVGPSNPLKRREYEDGLALFQEGAAVCLASTHKNIVKAHAIIEKNGTSYLVMDYYEGETLQALVEGKGPLNLAEALDLVGDILDGVAAIHTRNALHYDITPANVIIANPHPVLIDFGNARKLPISSDSPRIFFGTPGYAPPEQTPDRSKEHGPWTDVYASAATLYYLITGQTPPPASDRVVSKDSLPLKEVNKGLPRPVGNILRRALSLKPNYRPPVEMFRSQLRTARQRLTSKGAPPPTSPTTIAIGEAVKMAREVGPTVGLAVIIFIIAFFLLGNLPKAEEQPPQKTPIYVVPPANYYILHDASGSPKGARFDLVDDTIIKAFRTTAHPEDKSSFAYFGSDICSKIGVGVIPKASPGAGVINYLKSDVTSSCPDLTAATRFDKLFAGLARALEASDDRKDFIFIVTDGIPNRSGREVYCSENTKSHQGFIDKSTRDTLVSFMSSSPQAYILLILTGGNKGCLGGVQDQWTFVTKKHRDQFRVIAIPDTSSDDEVRNIIAKELDRKGRAACVSSWPKYRDLPVQQEIAFSNGDEFHAVFFFQSHLLPQSSSVEIRRAELHPLSDMKKSISVEVSSVEDENWEDFAKVDLDSTIERSSAVIPKDLRFRVRQPRRLSSKADYQLQLSLDNAASCASDLEKSSLRITPTQLTPALVQRKHTLRFIFYIIALAFLLFISACYRYWKGYDRIGRFFEAAFVEIFWHWVAFFLAVGIIFIVAILRSDVGGLYVWILGGLLLLEHLPLAKELTGLFREEITPPRAGQVVLSGFGALSTVILSWLGSS